MHIDRENQIRKHVAKESAERNWKYDIDSYMRWKNYLEKFPNISPQTIETIKDRLQCIRDKYPNIKNWE